MMVAMGRTAAARVIGLFLLGFGAAAVLAVLITHQSLLDVSDKLSSVLSAGLAVVGLVLSWQAARSAPMNSSERLENAARSLRGLIQRQWAAEVAARGFLQSDPLRVPWATTTRPVQVDAAEIAGPRVTRLKLHGDVAEAADAFRQLPLRRLVVIGGPGAGKSSLALLLVAGLSSSYAADEPLPLLANLSEWNPQKDRLDGWLARHLGKQYPSMSAFAAHLVEAGRVMPILDALDELPESLRRNAIVGLRESLGGTRPFVLTCRAEEFTDLISSTGEPLARAAVVELGPVSPTEVADYLPGGQIDGGRRWAAVIADLRSHRDGPVAVALATPLMVYLARTVYAGVQSDPAELLELGGATEIETHLLSAYLPAMYQPTLPATPGRRTFRAYAADEAGRWLSSVAADLRRRNTPDLAWWEMLPPASSLPVAAVVGVATVAVIASTANPQLLPTAYVGLLVGVACGLGAATFAARFRPLSRRAARLLYGFLFLIGAFATLFSLAAVILVPSVIIMMIAIRVRPQSAAIATPQSSLASERRVIIVVIAYFFFTGWAFGLLGSKPEDIITGTILGSFCGFMGGLLSKTLWLRFTVARLWSAARKHTPLRIMLFLHDAHRRGILRRIGPVYQFRHARLLEHLNHK
jgi:hypothetical protein